MKIAAKYSHMNGHEWLLVHARKTWPEIGRVVASVDANEHKTKASEEKGRAGEVLYSPTSINAALSKKFGDAGWKSSRTDHWVTDDPELIRKTIHLGEHEQRAMIEATGKAPIRSSHQTDFVKNRVAIEIQFGEHRFIAYDIFVKHLAFYVNDAIDVGVEILPMKAMQAKMSSGPGYYEGALCDIARQGRLVPTVPLVVVGVEP